MQEPSAPSVTTTMSACGPSASAASRAVHSLSSSAAASDLQGRKTKGLGVEPRVAAGGNC